jgi:hypothetical protein
MSGPFNPRWARRPNPFENPAALGGPGGPGIGVHGAPQGPVFPPRPAFNPPPAGPIAPSMGMPGGNPATGGATPPPGQGMPGVGQVAGLAQTAMSAANQAPGSAMASGAMAGAAFGPLGAGIGAGAGLLMSLLGGGKKHRAPSGGLLPPRR